MADYLPAIVIGGAWQPSDQWVPAINAAATAHGTPPNLVRAVLQRESGGVWRAESNPTDRYKRKKPDGSPNLLAGFAGIYETVALGWGCDWQAMHSSPAAQLWCMSRGLRVLYDTYGGGDFGKAATVYFGGVAALSRVFCDEQVPPMCSDEYTRKVVNDWAGLDALSEKEGPPVPITLGNVPKPPVREWIVPKSPGQGHALYGPRDMLVALIFHNVLGDAKNTYYHFASTTDPHGKNALTDWGVCNVNDGPDWDGTIIMWNDPDGPRSPYASGGDGSVAPHGDGPAILALCRQLNRNLNQITEAVEISRRRNYDPVGPKCLDSIVKLSAWRVDRKARLPWSRWPKNHQGLQMTLTHRELGKWSCDAEDVVGDVIQGVTEVLRFHQERGEPVPTPEYVRPILPDLGEWDGKDRTLNNVLLWSIRREFRAAKATPCYQYATRTARQVRAPLGVNEPAHSLYWFVTNDEAWIITPSGARIPTRDLTPRVLIEG